MRNALILSGAVILTLVAAYLWVSKLKAEQDEGATLWLAPWSAALALVFWLGWILSAFARQNAN
jgi:cytochrome bd-type quinol oxidase subunit 1